MATYIYSRYCLEEPVVVPARLYDDGLLPKRSPLLNDNLLPAPAKQATTLLHNHSLLHHGLLHHHGSLLLSHHHLLLLAHLHVHAHVHPLLLSVVGVVARLLLLHHHHVGLLHAVAAAVRIVTRAIVDDLHRLAVAHETVLGLNDLGCAAHETIVLLDNLRSAAHAHETVVLFDNDRLAAEAAGVVEGVTVEGHVVN